jgi:TM2 domain-containing membrane protein YozV
MTILEGNMSRIIPRPVEMRNPGIAAVLSFFIPGVGQIYNGKILRGIFWLIVTPGIWLGTGGWFGWVCHLIAAYTAYSYAKRHPYTN